MTNFKFNAKEDKFLSLKLIEIYPHFTKQNNYQNFNLFYSKLDNLLSDLQENEYWGCSDDYFNDLSVREMLDELILILRPSDPGYQKLTVALEYFDEQIISLTLDSGKNYLNFSCAKIKSLSSRIPKNAPDDFI